MTDVDPAGHRLREALERTLGNFRLLLAGKPVRDVTETIAEAEAALSEPTLSPGPALDVQIKALRDSLRRSRHATTTVAHALRLIDAALSEATPSGCLHRDLAGNPAHVPGCPEATPSPEPALDMAWAIFYEDPDHRTETFFGFGAEAAAIRRFEAARQTWNCTLFRQYAPMGWSSPTARLPSPDPALDVERLAEMRGLVEGWLDAERLLDTMTVDDGPAHQDAWDAVHFTREQLATEYARLASPTPEPSDG